MGAVCRILAAVSAVVLLACSSGPQDSAATYDLLPELAWDKFHTGIRDRVRVAYEEVEAAPRDAARNGELAMLLHAHEQFVNAEAFYRRAKRLEPGAMSWTYYLGLVQQRQAKHEEAVEKFSRSTEDRAGISFRAAAPGRFPVGSRQAGRSGEHYQAVIDEHPGIAEAHYGLGWVLSAKGHVIDSIKPLLRACELSPNLARPTTRLLSPTVTWARRVKPKSI